MRVCNAEMKNKVPIDCEDSSSDVKCCRTFGFECYQTIILINQPQFISRTRLSLTIKLPLSD